MLELFEGIVRELSAEITSTPHDWAMLQGNSIDEMRRRLHCRVVSVLSDLALGHTAKTRFPFSVRVLNSRLAVDQIAAIVTRLNGVAPAIAPDAIPGQFRLIRVSADHGVHAPAIVETQPVFADFEFSLFGFPEVLKAASQRNQNIADLYADFNVLFDEPKAATVSAFSHGLVSRTEARATL